MTAPGPLPPFTGTAVKIVIQHGVPMTWTWIQSRLLGKSVMIVGPGMAGKTTFRRYLKHGLFQPPQEYVKTLQQRGGKHFKLNIGPQQTLTVGFKRVVDLPGQADAAEPVYVARPHALLVILDVSAELDNNEAWLDEFLDHLDGYWAAGKPQKNRLRTVIVVMNKVDLIGTEVAEQHESAYRAIFASRFRAARGRHMFHGNVRFKRCVMVDTPQNTHGDGLLQAVVVDLAQDLMKD